MERRDFFSSVFANSNKKAGAFASEPLKIQGSLDEFSGELDHWTAKHLLGRVLFGYKKSDIENALTFNNISSLVENLLTDDEDFPDPPVKFVTQNSNDTETELGETWVGKPVNFQAENERIIGLKSWWMGNIIDQGFSIREKMTLFWHNHFATQTDVVRIGTFQYNTLDLYRRNSLGNFKELVERVTINPTMLNFLNGNQNIAGRPNENFARELFELFTIGKGPSIGEGNYTNFTEHDILEAAKVLTGWQTPIRGDRANFESQYFSFLHDKSTKRFSDVFDNKVITNKEQEEYKDLIGMIFDKEETSKYICRKLYKWFVYYHIDDDIEQNIIEPLAAILRDNNYNVKPVISTLLKSEHFYDTQLRGAMIKNPIDYTAGVLKNLNVKIPTIAPQSVPDYVIDYLIWYYNLYSEANEQQMSILDPPSVAGWEAYYQKPGYYRIWANSVTLPLRVQFSEAITSSRGLSIRQVRGLVTKVFGVEFAEMFSNPLDPSSLVDEMTDFLFPFELTQNQKDYLKLNLVNEGQEDYVWSDGWYAYEQNPDDPVARQGVETKLANFLKNALALAEYQLI